ncbi:HDOD domain-containing protein [Lacibacterium aquatile]|uniref:HDOD domain-containing protein n=1 Tax=Lacibacterium aquatile TaxID=1168082 RepID=A0ABW5DSU2_9PROT
MTKPRILFVDDEANVLNGLRRLLFAKRNDWDMQFAPSGAAALAIMAETPFDMIVSDMRMPSMDGAELLGEVMRLYPQTLRFILSGFSDDVSTTKALVRSHQLLSKPCDGKTLENRLERALAVRAHLKNESLRSVVGGLTTVPVLPKIYQQLTEALNRGETNDREIEAIVERQPILVARLLAVANSAFSGSMQSFTSAGQAIAYLGTNAVRYMALKCGMIGAMRHPTVGEFKAEAIVAHSGRVANIARLLAVRLGFDTLMVEETTVAGLLHDVGQLILMENFPDLYRDLPLPVVRNDRWLSSYERERLGASHAEVGAYVLASWGLSQWVIEAVLHHHEPAIAADIEVSPVSVVAMAERMASEPESKLTEIFGDALSPFGNTLHSLERDTRLQAAIEQARSPQPV